MREVKCRNCGGTGRVGKAYWEERECQVCHGFGKIAVLPLDRRK